MTFSRPLALLTLALCAAACQQPAPLPASDSTAKAPVHSARSAELFEVHCAVCHGEDGRADGPASGFLFPPARSFATGKFRLVSTVNGVPRDEDLVAMLKRGMPGSSMPSWAWLGESDLCGLASYVRELAVLGLADRLVAEAEGTAAPLGFEAAHEQAAARMKPGEVLPAPTDESIVDANLGLSLFRRNCATCHGMDGSGRPEPQFDEDGGLNWARDLTAGFLKGGATRRELAWRIGAGMPGSAMPATELDELELSSLVAHVQDLIPDQTDERLVQVPDSLRVRRVTGRLPLNPDDEQWRESDEIELVLAPLVWHDESVVYATLAAVHDGESIAIRLRWPDVTGKTTVLSDATRTDSAALQLSRASAPPLFGMGTKEHPTTIWYWRSIGLEEVAGALELLESETGVSHETQVDGVSWKAPLYHRLENTHALSERVERLTARGVEAMPDAEPENSEVVLAPRWYDGEWSVVFSRRFAPSSTSDVEFEAGASVQVACAIWNGAAGDRGAQKSISIWHEFQLDD